MEVRSVIMAKHPVKSPTYVVNVVVPTDLVGTLLRLVEENGGYLERMVSHGENGNGKLPSPETGRETIIQTLQEHEGDLHRKELKTALAAQGYAPASVGPLCTALRKEGKITSPRRGFWQLNGR